MCIEDGNIDRELLSVSLILLYYVPNNLYLYNIKFKKYIITRKMVPITERARSFLLVFKNKIERRGRQNKNNRPTNLPNVITFSTDFKYTTQS